MSSPSIQPLFQTAFSQSLPEHLLIHSDHPEYHVAKGVWNAAVDLHPTAIIRCRHTSDVIAALAVAREHNLHVAIRSGGHSPAGYGTCHEGMVIDLSGMKSLEVDVENQTARIEPGLTWGEVAEALHTHGLALTAGDTASVGVGGLAVGGGIGWMAGKYGLTIDRLRAVELVTADGQVLHVSHDENPELFWGLRGGGGNFGIVTAFEFDLHPGGMIYGGAVFYEADETGELLQAYSRVALEAPDELTTQLMIMAAPPAPFIPPALVGKAVAAVLICYCGDLAAGEEAVAPLRQLGNIVADLVGPMPYPALLSLAEAGTICGLHHNFRSMFLESIEPEMAQALTRESLAAMSPTFIAQLRTITGQARRIPADETAFSHRDKPFLLLVDCAYGAPEDKERVTAHMERVEAALAPFSAGNHVNFLGRHQSEQDKAYSEATHRRLAVLKHRYDPNNIFCHNWNILPEVGEAQA